MANEIDIASQRKWDMWALSIKRQYQGINTNIIAIGKALDDAHEDMAKHGSGIWTRWVEANFPFTRETARKMRNVFLKSSTISFANPSWQSIETSAIYRLFGPSVPEKAVTEVLQMAVSATVNDKQVKAVLERYKPAEKPKPKASNGKPSGGITFNPAEFDSKPPEPAPAAPKNGQLKTNPLFSQWEDAFGKIKRLTGELKRAAPNNTRFNAVNDALNVAYAEVLKWKG